ncbi:MAG: hypothetical protein BWZ10_03403 [candidate division BRC1 bacterium ADurb.BinA364]|nr:MAG: hypothetical protein BWZ10_03403 [candidate division BRC1 bacterium ADurb.BinA364]
MAGRQGTSGFWSPLAKIENNRQERTWIELPRPAPLRQIRLEITRPNHFAGNPIARVAEIAIWGKAQK